MTKSAADPLLVPTRALSIGVTGHRPERLAGTDLTALAASVEHVLDTITACAGENMRPRLVSALAEGADSIVTDAALARGWPLDVVLPFARAVYATDFGSGGVQDAHLARLARARAVFELPGDRAEAGAAYERAGRIVLAQSDILIAVWDGGPVRGRGGAPQIVAEAVLAGIPVIQIDPAHLDRSILLWDGFEDADLGQQGVETVPRGDLSALPDIINTLIDPPQAASERKIFERFLNDPPMSGFGGIAYPALLEVMGVRSPRKVKTSQSARAASPIGVRFARADTAATRIAQRFRSSYVSNFALAAAAVLLSLLGLALPPVAKPVLILLEIVAIGTILITTRVGNRANWHRRWLDNRTLAERLRCLQLSAELGDLDLRGNPGEAFGWVSWYTKATARELGLPTTCVNAQYLATVKSALSKLIDGQLDYLKREAQQMHSLDHRLHVVGTTLFGATALTCVVLLAYKASHAALPGLDAMQAPIATVATIFSAAFPAIGAAIYGIRMQGDFAGTAERNGVLADQLTKMRRVIDEDPLDFDTLSRRVRRTSDLLTGDLATWLHTYHARPLTLPG